MTDCEYETLCDDTWSDISGCDPKNPSPCAIHKFAELVHNNAIEEVIVEVDDGEWQDCVELRMKVEALKKPASQEGE